MAALLTSLAPKHWLIVGTVFSLLLGGCNPPAPSTAENAETSRPKVVTTSTVLTDWAMEVGGEAIALVGILAPGADPHIYEPTPQDGIALEQAALILYNGYNLEPNLIRLINGAGVSARKVAVGEVVSPLDFAYQGQSVPDPHVWGDVKHGIQMVERLRDELIQLSPEDAAIFQANADAYITELTALDQWIAEQIQTIPPDQRQLVTTHDAFQYYARAYGLTVAGTLIGISTEEQPSAQTVQRLADAIKTLGIPAIFAETTLNPRLIATVAEEAGIRLASSELYSDSIGAPGSEGDTYVRMMVANTRAIVENLGGTYTPFQP
jgi:manganese/iron transport system substrate-binding protein